MKPFRRTNLYDHVVASVDIELDLGSRVTVGETQLGPAKYRGNELVVTNGNNRSNGECLLPRGMKANPVTKTILK